MRACPLVSTALCDTCLAVRTTHCMLNSVTDANGDCRACLDEGLPSGLSSPVWHTSGCQYDSLHAELNLFVNNGV